MLNDAYWSTRSYVPNGIKEQVTPHLLPYDHPARKLLDLTYQNKRDLPTIGTGQNANLKKLPELLEKHGLVIKEPSKYGNKWKTQLRRVQGHSAGRLFIEKSNIDHVKITQNWLYPLPGATNAASKAAFIAYNLTILVRKTLKALHIKSPKWLKYGDIILRDRFIVVEEFVNIQFPKRQLLKSLPQDITDEYKKVFEFVGFQDAKETNYSLTEDGTITLFDLDQYSKKRAKNADNGKWGIRMLFPDRYPRP